MDDLLDLTQLREGFFSLVREPFDQEDVVNFILNMFAPKAQAKGIIIRRKYLNCFEEESTNENDRFITKK